LPCTDREDEDELGRDDEEPELDEDAMAVEVGEDWGSRNR
jgi:hypothetical protein